MIPLRSGCCCEMDSMNHTQLLASTTADLHEVGGSSTPEVEESTLETVAFNHSLLCPTYYGCHRCRPGCNAAPVVVTLLHMIS